MPSSKKYKRNYQQENVYKSTPEQIHARVLRNAARSTAVASGLVTKGSSKQVDHIKPISKGGTNAKSNLRVVPASTNESFLRSKTGALVNQVSTSERKVSTKERTGQLTSRRGRRKT